MNIDHIVSTNQANHCLITHRHSAASAQLPKSRLRVHINIDRLDSINRLDLSRPCNLDSTSAPIDRLDRF